MSLLKESFPLNKDFVDTSTAYESYRMSNTFNYCLIKTILRSIVVSLDFSLNTFKLTDSLSLLSSSNTVEPRYLELAYFQLPLISK